MGIAIINMDMKFKQWLEIAEQYPPVMREAARRFRHHKLLKEGAEPQLGAYYWIPLPNKKWDLMTFFESHYGDSAMHDQLWESEVVPYLAHAWKLNPQQIQTIQHSSAGLPRGRICRMKRGYAHMHGNDAPVKANLDSIIKREFGLPAMTSVFDFHEQMLQLDVADIQSVFGDLGLKGV